MNRQDLRINKNESMSLQRPAWVQDDLHAYHHRHYDGKIGVVKDWFAKRKGLIGR